MEIERQIGCLCDYPEIGRLGRLTGTRELVINRTPLSPYTESAQTRSKSSACCMAHNYGHDPNPPLARII
jgi:hypothetical protein